MQVFAEQAFSNQLLTQAQNGDTTAQLDLAEAYLYGNGIQRDTEQAEVWGIKSAENGNPKAMFWLAEGYTFYALFNQKNDKKDVLFDSINNIAQISQKNSAASEEVTASVEQQTSANNQMYSLSSGMTEKAAKLKEAIEKFKF